MRVRRLLLAAAVTAGVLAVAPSAFASHSCAQPLNTVCALTCRPVEIWC